MPSHSGWSTLRPLWQVQYINGTSSLTSLSESMFLQTSLLRCCTDTVTSRTRMVHPVAGHKCGSLIAMLIIQLPSQALVSCEAASYEL